MSIDISFGEGGEAAKALEDTGTSLFPDPASFVVLAYYTGKALELLEQGDTDDKMNAAMLQQIRDYVADVNPPVDVFDSYLAFSIKAACMLDAGRKLPDDPHQFTPMVRQLFAALFLRTDSMEVEEAGKILEFFPVLLGSLRGILMGFDMPFERIDDIVSDLSLYQECLNAAVEDQTSFTLSY
jgi:hypothetical protein